MIKNKIIYALDSQQMFTVDEIIELNKYIAYYKIGYNSIASNSFNNQLDMCDKYNLSVMLDMKLHDTPNTVSNFIKLISRHKCVKLITIHSTIGWPTLVEASKASKTYKIDLVSVIQLSTNYPIKSKILFERINECLMYGITKFVCPYNKIHLIKASMQSDIELFVPGIRPKWYEYKKDDQIDPATPEKAIKLGANYLIIGRPIYEHKNPLEAITLIQKEINNE